MQGNKRNLIGALLIAALIAAVCIAGCLGSTGADSAAGQVTLKVFHAGSLTAPFEEMETAFEAAHPNVDVQLHPGGSTKVCKEIVELDKSADVYASADYSLIPDLMMPDDADWYLTFAKNRMVLSYTDESRYAGEITTDNWYGILAKDDVKWAFSDPNQDPCGYRSPMVIQLAELYYNDDRIFETTVGAHSAMTVTEEGGVYTIHATEPEPEGSLQIRPKSVELVQMLQAGGLDYAWEYRSVAVQNGLRFLELPEEVDLSSLGCADTYAKVQTECSGGMKKGKPIVYGVTVPKNAVNPGIGLEFIKMLVSETGQAGHNGGAGAAPDHPCRGFRRCA